MIMAAATAAAGIGSLNVPDMLNLRSFFTDEENNTFEQISMSYQRDFNRKDNLRVGIALLTMLQQHDLIPRPTQRLVALYLLYEMYAKEITILSQNPFAPVFLKLLSTPEVDSQQPPGTKKVESALGKFPLITKQERYFMVHLLGGAGRDLLKKTPKQIMSLELPSAPTMDLTNLEAAVKDAQSHHPSSLSAVLPIIIPLPDEHAAKDVQYSEQQATLKTCEELLTGVHPPSLQSFRPHILRLAPPLHVAEDEYIWLHPIESEKFVPLFDKDMLIPTEVPPSGTGTDATPSSAVSDYTSAHSSVSNEVSSEEQRTDPTSASSYLTSGDREQTDEHSQNERLVAGSDTGLSGDSSEWDPVQMLQRAMDTQLAMRETNWLVDQLTTGDESIVHKVGMSPAKLPSLVDNNPLVAVEVLLKLLSSKDLPAYFEILIHMDLSVQGLEVVNRLTTNVDLPEELLHVYVLNCIAACEGMQENSLGQSRLVRLVCVFLQALIRNKVINVQALYVELQAFCINFSNIKEAAALFRMVQALSSGNSVDEEGAGN